MQMNFGAVNYGIRSAGIKQAMLHIIIAVKQSRRVVNLDGHDTNPRQQKVLYYGSSLGMRPPPAKHASILASCKIQSTP
jgi:hypothetical protein